MLVLTIMFLHMSLGEEKSLIKSLQTSRFSLIGADVRPNSQSEKDTFFSKLSVFSQFENDQNK